MPMSLKLKHALSNHRMREKRARKNRCIRCGQSNANGHRTCSECLGVAEAQEKLVATGHIPDAPSTRRFWSAENKIELSIFAGQLAADAITTQKGLSEGFREVNPLMRPLVTRGVAGQATASALSFGAGLGTVYLLHVTHHYRAERITLRLILAGEGALVGHNIALLRGR